jgi:hypothetical protein
VTALAIFLLIAGWTLVYTGFVEPSGDIRVEISESFGKSAKPAASVRPRSSGAPRGTIGPGV